MKRLVKPLFERLDHQRLYEIVDLADCDTASIARWVPEHPRAELPQFDRVDLEVFCGVRSGMKMRTG